MKYLSIVLSSIALLLAGILFYQHQTQNSKLRGLVTEIRSGDTTQAKILKIAYVDLDSIDARFEFYKGKIEAFEKKKEYDQQLQYLENQRRKTEQDVQQEAMIMRDDIFKKINEYLSGYCKERGYTYVFSYSKNANIFLYEDPVFNITEDVITGLNAMYKKEEKKK